MRGLYLSQSKSMFKLCLKIDKKFLSCVSKFYSSVVNREIISKFSVTQFRGRDAWLKRKLIKSSHLKKLIQGAVSNPDISSLFVGERVTIT